VDQKDTGDSDMFSGAKGLNLGRKATFDDDLEDPVLSAVMIRAFSG